MSARPHHVGSPYDKDNAEWMLARFKEWGWDATIERFDVLFPTPKTRLLEMVAPDAVRREARGAGRGGGPDVRPEGRAAADLQRLLDRRRRDGAAGLRELRPARRLRGARAPRRLGQGRHRHRALRRVVARHQAEGGGRARRGRLPDLLRSERRRLFRRRRCSRKARCAPRDGVQRGSVADMPVYPGDPLTPGVGATPEAKRLAASRREDDHEDSGAADLVRRRAAAAGRAGRPGGARRLARRAADHLSRRARARPRCTSSWRSTGTRAALRRDRADARARRIPTSGSSAATITTPG